MRYYLLSKHLKKETLNCWRVRGHYVYKWLDQGKTFYIGSGSNRRAWNTHRSEIEQRRRKSRNFRVVIMMDNLTKQAAHSIERAEINRHLKLGYSLMNEKRPSEL